MNVDVRIEGIPQLQEKLKNWDASMRRNMRSALIKIGNAWVTEAKKRVPVSAQGGFLRNSINKEVSVVKTSFTLAVGSNAKYAPFIEFGTEHIAGGRVKALGTGPIIYDSQAVTTWPAIQERGGSNQQMPWLRPSWIVIKSRAIELMSDALSPKGQIGTKFLGE